MRSVLSVFLIALLAPAISLGETKAKDSLLDDMHAAYQAFRDLQPFLYREEAFEATENREQISSILNKLSNGFHKVELKDSKFSKEPGFISSVKILNEMLEDARSRFVEGKLGYTRWRLRTLSTNCVSCHTRYQVDANFSGDDVNLKSLNAYERGEFLLATRQFDKASKYLLEAVKDEDLAHLRMNALRKWLLIYTRVNPKPEEALEVLDGLKRKVKFSLYEKEEIEGWIASLTRWQQEREVTMHPVRRAETLIRQGLWANDPMLVDKGIVELLRGTSILHKFLEDDSVDARFTRGHALYLLGLAYSELKSFFASELPEFFLKACIREYPGTEDAKVAFKVYQELVVVNFTGSGGTRIPEDVQLQLQELHDQAYSMPTIRS